MVVDFAHSLDGKAAGFLTTFVSTHSVGDDRQATLAAKFVLRFWFPKKIGIFVIVALQADVGQAGGFNSWFRIRNINRHRRRVSCRLRKREIELSQPAMWESPKAWSL